MAQIGQYILKATCGSRMGTIARVSTFLADRRCYIDEMQQFDDALTKRFHMRCAFRPDDGRSPPLEELKRQFIAVAQAEEMDCSMLRALLQCAMCLAM
jgi:formyltetrahydrofolate deformylase